MTIPTFQDRAELTAHLAARVDDDRLPADVLDRLTDIAIREADGLDGAAVYLGDLSPEAFWRLLEEAALGLRGPTFTIAHRGVLLTLNGEGATLLLPVEPGEAIWEIHAEGGIVNATASRRPEQRREARMQIAAGELVISWADSPSIRGAAFTTQIVVGDNLTALRRLWALHPGAHYELTGAIAGTLEVEPVAPGLRPRDPSNLLALAEERHAAAALGYDPLIIRRIRQILALAATTGDDALADRCREVLAGSGSQALVDLIRGLVAGVDTYLTAELDGVRYRAVSVQRGRWCPWGGPVHPEGRVIVDRQVRVLSEPGAVAPGEWVEAWRLDGAASAALPRATEDLAAATIGWSSAPLTAILVLLARAEATPAPRDLITGVAIPRSPRHF